MSKMLNVPCGKYKRRCIEIFAQLVGSQYLVIVSSGIDNLIIILSVLYDYWANRGNQVIVPALSFVSTANCAISTGLRPFFVDVVKETLNIDVNQIEKVDLEARD